MFAICKQIWPLPCKAIITLAKSLLEKIILNKCRMTNKLKMILYFVSVILKNICRKGRLEPDFFWFRKWKRSKICSDDICLPVQYLLFNLGQTTESKVKRKVFQQLYYKYYDCTIFLLEFLGVIFRVFRLEVHGWISETTGRVFLLFPLQCIVAELQKL